MMLGLGWITLRQAEEALQNGRLEEAHRLLSQPESAGHKGSSTLLRQVAQKYAERGQEHLRHGDLPKAWNDLLQAEKTGAAGSEVVRLRAALTQRALNEVRKLLDAGEPRRALEALGRLQPASTPDAEAQLLEEVARGWNQARELTARGEIGGALQQIERVRPLLPRAPAPLERLRNELEERRPRLSGLIVQLHDAWRSESWHDVVELAEQILALAPMHAEARKAQGRAWKALESPAGGADLREERQEDGERFLLWVDGAGGCLVCLGRRVTLGVATPDSKADIALLADVSRMHAAIQRDAEGYVLEAMRPVLVNGQVVEKGLLQAGDRISLGNGCQLEFRQPVPVSTSARLDVVSGHRLSLALDGVLLMADTLVLGPGPQAHVVVPDLEQNVVLFRQKDGLGVRYGGSMTIDGQTCEERGTLSANAHVRGPDFSFALEPVGTRMGRQSGEGKRPVG